MRDSKRWVPSVCSFAAGALLGMFTVFVPLGSLRASARGSEASLERRVPVDMSATVGVSQPQAAAVQSSASEPIAGTKPAARDGRKSRASDSRPDAGRHCELDLQLD